MCKVGCRDSVNNKKVSIWFSVEDIADLVVQRGSNQKKKKKKRKEKKKFIEKILKKYKNKWLNNQQINLINKATTYHSTHFVMETVSLVPFVIS